MTPLQLAFYNQLCQEPGTYVWLTKNFVLSEESEILSTLLVQHKFKIANRTDKNRLYHFHISCTRNLTDVFQVFIDRGADVNQSISMNFDKFAGYAPLHLVGINMTSRLNQLPLRLACFYSSTAIVELLVNNGAFL